MDSKVSDGALRRALEFRQWIEEKMVKEIINKIFEKRIRSIILVGFFVFIGAVGFVGGAANSDSIVAVAKDRYQDLQLFTKVLNLVQQYYVEEVDTKKLVYGGIKGMLQELDPHTNFLSPDVFKEFESETSGEFGGIGIEITVQNDILTVISPIEDTPAWEAGIKSGDKIVEINGVSTKGFSLAEAAQHMRGKTGSKVRMGIFREGFDKPKVFEIARATVKIHSVKMTDLDDGYGYIRLTSFIENSSIDLEKAIRTLEKDHKQIKGIILDLRRNPGGLLDQAIKISDLFLEEGTIVSTIGRNKREKEVVYAKKDGTMANFPLVVLINEYSASASEILAGALQDNQRALIMGQQSFGKGSVQSVVKLGDGSGLKLTVARYYTPSGRSIQAEGIKPDVTIEDVDSEAFKKAIVKRDIRREQDIAGHLQGDREKKQAAAAQQAAGQQTTGQTQLGRSDVNFWWVQETSNKKGSLSAKDKLLLEDFQAFQAFNYLKAWKVMEKFNAAKAQPVSAPAELGGGKAPSSAATSL
jgi:carboxyl-terminal processing protease